jgi:hypothetical protein
MDIFSLERLREVLDDIQRSVEDTIAGIAPNYNAANPECRNALRAYRVALVTCCLILRATAQGRSNAGREVSSSRIAPARQERRTVHEISARAEQAELLLIA